MIQWNNHSRIRPDSFADAKAQLARDKWSGTFSREVINIGTRLTPDFDDIFKPGSRNQRRASAFALQQSIGRHRCSMHDFELHIFSY